MRAESLRKPFEPPTQGSLDGWLDGLKDPCRASSYLTFGIGLAFAGPLLHLVGQDEGAIFYLAGESSTGKTLTELAGLSAIERAVRVISLTHDATDRRIEEDCAAHNDLLQVIDEISRMTGSQAELPSQGSASSPTRSLAVAAADDPQKPDRIPTWLTCAGG